VLKEWIISRKAVRGEGSYSLRIVKDLRNINQLLMCNTSFLNLMCIGKTHWNTILKTKLKLGPNMHGNDGNDHRARNSAVAACFVDLCEHFNEINKMHGEANATRVVREVTGMGLPDEEKGATELPSHFTKRIIYIFLLGEGLESYVQQ
jgi:hypothetical protein